MRISTKGRYATRAMLDLALHYGDGFTSVKDVARRQEMSEKYLENLLVLLKVGGLVRSVRGVHGGFVLARPASEIKLSEIIQVMEGSMAPVECVDAPEAYPRAARCAVHDLWEDIARAMSQILESTTLEELAERQSVKEAASV